MNQQIIEAMQMVLEHFKHLHSNAKQMQAEASTPDDEEYYKEERYYYYNVVSALEDEVDHLKEVSDN